MNEEIKLVLLNETTIEQQVFVYRSAFDPSSNIEDNIIAWHKKHYENPLGDSIIVGAYMGDQLVGINAYMPVQYNVNGESVKMLQSCESGVLPTCQGKGIWKKVVTYALNYISKETDYQLVIGFPNFRNSYPGFKKMGWKTVSNMKNYVMVNNLSALNTVFHNKGWLFRFFLNGIILQRVLVSICSLNKSGFRIEEIPIEALIWDNDNQNKLECDHSVSLLKWKRDYKQLSVISVKNGDVVVASCLYGFGSYNNSTIIKIESFQVLQNYKNKKRYLFAILLKYLAQRYHDVSFVRVWTQEKTKLETLLKSLLFMGSSHPNPFITSNPNSIYSNMEWSLSFFDLD